MSPITYRSEEFLFHYVPSCPDPRVLLSQKGSSKHSSLLSHNKEQSSHPFTAAVAKKLSASLRVVCAVKMSVLMFLRFSRPVKVSWEMVETN